MPKILEINPITLQIVKQLYNLKEGEEIYRFKLTKKIFPSLSVKHLRIKDTIINNELLKLGRFGIIEIVKQESKVEYNLMDSHCYVGKFKFPYDGDKKGIALKIDNKWTIFED